MADDVVGFHAQQAVEKALKMALVLNGAEFRRTHDLEFLIARVQECEITLPAELQDTEWLTPWAAALRYDEPTELDRAAAVAAAESAAQWAASLLDA